MNFDDLLDLLKVLSVEQRQILAESLPIPTWQPGTTTDEIPAGSIGPVLLDRDLTTGTETTAKNITGAYLPADSRVSIRSDGGVLQIDFTTAPGVPPGILVPYGGAIEPAWGVFANGQTLPTDPPYHRLAAALGQTGTSMTVPNVTNRTVVFKGSGAFATLLATGGAMSRTIAQANLPNVNFTVNITDPGHAHEQRATSTQIAAGGGSDLLGMTFSGGNSSQETQQDTESATTGITATAASGGSGTALDTTPSFVVLNPVWTL